MQTDANKPAPASMPSRPGTGFTEASSESLPSTYAGTEQAATPIPMVNMGPRRSTTFARSATDDTIATFASRPSTTQTTYTTASDYSSVTKVKQRAAHAISNKHSGHWMDLVRPKVTVLPAIALRLLFVTVWSAAVCVFYLVPQVAFLKAAALPNNMILTTVLGVSISLLLGFRTNTAYDRFWEGRRLWGTIRFHSLNMSRLIYVFGKESTSDESLTKTQALQVLSAVSVAVKHRLRNEMERNYIDLSAIEHVQALGNAIETNNLTSDLCSYVHAYLISTGMSIAPVWASLSMLQDAVSALERIHDTPIPQAYGIHMKQCVTIYLLSLPFQIVGMLAWFTIPVVFLSAFVMTGLLEISQKIENPFGYDVVDLDTDVYCEEIGRDLGSMASREDSGSTLGWNKAFSMESEKVDRLKKHNK
ncbi:hypothetical protein HDU77_001593 [Chytriomyces hyalinus]|nr:hypothetical protein HDU77_001593 [Chytriomyces hyalinus]